MDEQTAQEEREDKLKQCIDNLMDKRYGCPGLSQPQMRLRRSPSVTTPPFFSPLKCQDPSGRPGVFATSFLLQTAL